MRFEKSKKLIALLSVIAMLLSLVPVTAVADGELDVPATAPRFSQAYTAMSGVAIDAEVAGMRKGASYIAYWENTAYTFLVGVDVFADFEEAYSAISYNKMDPNIFLLTGENGDLTITAPVTVYGNYHGVNPNSPQENVVDCPTLNGARQHDRESCVANLYIAENVLGDVTIDGVVLQGNFVDALRPVNEEATSIVLKNSIIRHEAGVPDFETWAFNLNTPNNQNATESAVNNKDSFTIKDCRIEHLETQRISSNNIVPNFTIDGLVTVSGATPFFGFPQWKRYMENATFTVKNCHFEDFSDSRNYFIVMEGLNKHSGKCTINFENNVFRGDASSYMVEVYTKPGYDINIVGNTFIARSKTGLEPFKWNVSYDLNYSDSASNADVTNVDLSGIMEIKKNRFIGFTKFSKTVNTLTTFDITDNFFTDDLETYKTTVGKAPSAGTGWNGSAYWVDFDLKTYSTVIPEVVFTSAEIIDGAAAKILYTDKTKISLYDYGFKLPKGVKFSISGGESASAISVSSGVRTIQIKVYSYDGTRSADTALMIYGRPDYSEAVAALQEARIRIGSGCYTEASLAAYQSAALALQDALTAAADPTEAIATLATAKARLVMVNGAEAELKYFDYFTGLKKFKIIDSVDWATFAEIVGVDLITLGGYTIRLANDIDFGGATIKPIGGCFPDNDTSNNYSFNGTFDGGGHEISNFVINENSYGVGVFGKLYSATVKNLQISNATITGVDKVGALAGYADQNCNISGIVNKAAVKATDGAMGIGGIVSQARWNTKLTGCINYGSVTTVNGRACGIAAWGQTTAVMKCCINYGTLSGPDTYPLGLYDVTVTDYTNLVADCFYASGSSLCGGNLISVFDQFTLKELYEYAWKGGLNLRNGILVPDGAGTKIYRATLTCTNNGKTYYYYGPSNSQISFDLPGYVVDTVFYNGSNRPLKGLLLTKDCTMTGAAIRVTYDITYHLDGGSSVIDLPATYTAETYTALPSVGQVTKSGYVFYGFYDNASFSGAPIYSIPEDSEGDLHLYAKYIPLDRTITTAAQLVDFAKAVNNGTNFKGKAVMIGANINLSGTSYPVIGSAMGTPFQGLLYGGGHTISNLSVSNKPLAGLVGCLGADGMVAGLLVTGTVSGNVTGGIVANNQGGSVQDCYFNGKASSTATELKIISQNVYVSDISSARCNALVNSIKSYNADLIGFQEVTKKWESYLKNGFSNYGYIWQYRGSGSNTTSAGLEATPLFYNKNTLTLLSSGNFWLSDTPNKASYCWDEDSGMNRVCSWGKFQVKATGEIFWHFNTHYPLKEENRQKSSVVMKNQVQSLVPSNMPFFMTGDWNTHVGVDSYEMLDEWSDDVMLYAEVNDSEGLSSANGEWSPTPQSGRNIDMLFGDMDKITCPYYSLILATYTSSGKTYSVSDHWAIYYRIKMDSASGGIVGKNYGDVTNCIATNSGSAAISGGVLSGINRGTVDKSAVFSGTAVGRDEGATAYVTVSDVTNAAYTLNNINESAVWSVSGNNLVLLPAGNHIYDISFYDTAGNLLKTEKTTLDAALAWNPSLDTASQVFSHWDQKILSNSASFTAVMKARSFKVTFLDANGSVISTQDIDYGKAALPPSVTVPAGKIFAGWNSSYTNVTTNLEIAPIFVDDNVFTLTVLTEGDGSSLAVNGESVAAGKSFTVAGGTEFVLQADDNVLYWKDEGGKIISESARTKISLTRHMTLTAVYPTNDRCTVTFVDADNTILKVQIIRSGRNATAPSTPSRAGMVFANWTNEFKSVKTDVITRATYTPEGMVSVSVVGGTASATSVALGERVTFVADEAPEGKVFAGWSIDGLTVISQKSTFSMSINSNVKLTALYNNAKYAPVAVTNDGDGNFTLTRITDGDYTVLGSGILYSDGMNVLIELECVDGVNVKQLCDTRLTRNGTMVAKLTATYIRGYAILLNEVTGEVEYFYSSVMLVG